MKESYSALNMSGHSLNVVLRKIILPQIQSNYNEKTSNQICGYRFKPLPNMCKKISISYTNDVDVPSILTQCLWNS